MKWRKTFYAFVLASGMVSAAHTALAADDVSTTIESIEATKLGYRVMYSDDTEEVVKVYSKSSNDKKTKVVYYEDNGLVAVLKSNGTKIRLVDVETGEVVKKIKLSDDKYGKNSLTSGEIRDKNVLVVASQAKKRDESLLHVIRVKLNDETIKLKDTQLFTDTRMKVKSVDVKKKKVELEDTDDVEYTVKVNSDYEFGDIEQD